VVELVASEALVWSTPSPAVNETLSTKFDSLEQLILFSTKWWLMIGPDAPLPIGKVLTMLLRCKPIPEGLETATGHFPLILAENIALIVCSLWEEIVSST
jgi:hypothetical protein